MNKKIKATAALSLTAVAALGANANVFALDESWGPQDRPTYSWSAPATAPVFNSITDNPSLGDERNFVRVREYGTDNIYEDYVDITPGKEYEVYVYYHNNASATFNSDGSGIAQNVRLTTESPANLEAGKTAVIKGTITWGTEGNMQNVWDTAFLTAKEAVTLSYVANSATIHNGGDADGQILDADAMFDYGVLLAHTTKHWGIIPGCNEYAGYVTFRLKAEAVDTPKELPKTGPAEIAMATAIVLGICGGSFYLYRSRKALNKVNESVIGGPSNASDNVESDKNDNDGSDK